MHFFCCRVASSTKQGALLKTSHPDYNKRKCKQYRDRLTPEQRAAYNEKAKQRMRKRRDILKHQQKVQTRKDKGEQRSKWRTQKQNHMKSLSPAEKENYLHRRREAYRRRVIKSKGQYRTVVPNSPEKFADFVHALIASSSPRKRLALQRKGVKLQTQRETMKMKVNEVMTRNLRKVLLRLKKKRKNHERKDMRIIVKAMELKNRSVIRSLGMRYFIVHGTICMPHVHNLI